MNKKSSNYIFVTVRFSITEYMEMIKKLSLDENKSSFIRGAVKAYKQRKKLLHLKVKDYAK